MPIEESAVELGLRIDEAMAAKTPVVSTTIGAEGLPLTPGRMSPGRRPCSIRRLLSRTDEVFARFGTRWPNPGTALSARNFAWEQAARRFEEVLATTVGARASLPGQFAASVLRTFCTSHSDTGAAGGACARDREAGSPRYGVAFRVTDHCRTRRRRDWIARKLESVFALDYPRGLMEVIVVSDGSTDRTEQSRAALRGVASEFWRFQLAASGGTECRYSGRPK